MTMNFVQRRDSALSKATADFSDKVSVANCISVDQAPAILSNVVAISFRSIVAEVICPRNDRNTWAISFNTLALLRLFLPYSHP